MENRVFPISKLDIEVLDGDRGKNYPHQDELFKKGHCLFLSASNVTRDGFKFGSTMFISKEKDEVLRGGKLCRNDIVITTRGTVGNVAYYDENVPYKDIRINSGMLIVRCGKELNSKYVYYVLRSPEFQKQIRSIQTGSAQPQLPKSHFIKMLICVPKLEIQNKIASILSVLDRKIENNAKINDNLQQQATALFANFYDQAETEIGFTEIVQILSGGTPKTGESSYWNGNVPFFTPKDVGLPYTLTTEKTITEEGLAHCNSRLYPINTVFVTARGTVGKVGLAGVPMAMNQSCYALDGKNTHQLLVYFYTLKAVDRLKHKASGAVFDAITTRDFDSEIIMKLSDDDAGAFLDVAEPIYQAILSNSIENLRLAALRDSLLPKLISGEIDVSDVKL